MSHFPTNLASPRGQFHQHTELAAASTKANAAISQRRRFLTGLQFVGSIASPPDALYRGTGARGYEVRR
jgi:hypothetical protein